MLPNDVGVNGLLSHDATLQHQSCLANVALLCVRSTAASSAV